MASVSIGSSSYYSYASVATADTYLAGEASATDWRAQADSEVKARDLVTATRLIDRLSYAGSMTESDQGHAFPRTGLPGGWVDDEVPQPVIDACCLLASMIEAGVDVTGKASTAAGAVKRQAAGSVSIEYFKDLNEATRLPQAVHELLAPFFGAASVGAGSISYGTDECSHISDFRTGYGF